MKPEDFISFKKQIFSLLKQNFDEAILKTSQKLYKSAITTYTTNVHNTFINKSKQNEFRCLILNKKVFSVFWGSEKSVFEAIKNVDLSGQEINLEKNFFFLHKNIKGREYIYQVFDRPSLTFDNFELSSKEKKFIYSFKYTLLSLERDIYALGVKVLFLFFENLDNGPLFIMNNYLFTDPRAMRAYIAQKIHRGKKYFIVNTKEEELSFTSLSISYPTYIIETLPI